MQTILGAGGAIGTEMAKELTRYTQAIRLVSRNPKKINPTDQLFPADITNADELDNAIAGSEIVYLLVGFPYSVKQWKQYWPSTVRNIIKSCKKHHSKLVFFDNIYMYDPNFLSKMDEDTPQNPSSKKGKIRKEVADMIMKEVQAGTLTALIARSADFYGPGIERNSVLNETATKNLAKGKAANWFCSLDKKHSYTYTPDAMRATALLGNTPDAYQQVWHLPTAPDPLTGREWVDAIAAALEVKPKAMAVPAWVIKTAGLFIPIMRELGEMLYQYDRDYVFSSEKFEKHFGISPTPYQEGIKEMVKADYGK